VAVTDVVTVPLPFSWAGILVQGPYRTERSLQERAPANMSVYSCNLALIPGTGVWGTHLDSLVMMEMICLFHLDRIS
jgi:hypothetical protein